MKRFMSPLTPARNAGVFFHSSTGTVFSFSTSGSVDDELIVFRFFVADLNTYSLNCSSASFLLAWSIWFPWLSFLLRDGELVFASWGDAIVKRCFLFVITGPDWLRGGGGWVLFFATNCCFSLMSFSASFFLAEACTSFGDGAWYLPRGQLNNKWRFPKTAFTCQSEL